MKSRITVISILGSTVLLSVGLLSQQPHPTVSLPTTQQRPEAGEPDDPWARSRWFWEQRTYPGDTIPIDTHREAVDAELRRGLSMRMAENELTPTWTELGPAPLKDIPVGVSSRDASGRALAVAIHPINTEVVLLGTAQGGIWRSTDGAATFAAVAENQPSLAVKVIRFAPSNPSMVYAGTGEPHVGTSIFGAGVLKSTDAGQSWQALPLSGVDWDFQYSAISGLRIDPNNANTLYVTTAIIATSVPFFNPPFFGRPVPGVFKSVDGGQTWTRLLSATTYPTTFGPGFMDLEMAGATVLYATENGGGIYKTVNGGVNWNLVTPLKSATAGGALPAPVSDFSHFDAANGRFSLLARLSVADDRPDFDRIEIGVSPVNPDMIYAGYALFQRMLLDVDGDGAFDPSADVTTSVGLLFRSSDGGQTWTWLGDWPRNGTPEYCGDQCIYDNTVEVNPNDANDVIIGGNLNFARLWPDPLDNPTRLLALSWRGMLYRSLDGGQTWIDTTPHCGSTNFLNTNQTAGDPPLPVFVCALSDINPSLVIHPDIQSAAFEPGTGRIYVTTDGGLYRGSVVAGRSVTNPLDYRWENLNAGLATLQFYFFDVHPTDPNKILGGMQDNSMGYYTGSPVWEGWGAGDGTLGAFDPNSPSIVYYGSQFTVFRHDNGGVKDFADPNWIEIISQNMFAGEQISFLPGFEIDPVQSNFIYTATDVAVYKSSNRGGAGGADNWTQIGQTNGRPTSISVSPQSNNLIWIGTATGHVHLSDGISFMEKTSRPLPERFVTKVEASPIDANTVFVAFSGYNANTPSTPGKVFKSSDQGTTWVDISGNLPDVPVSALALDPNNGNRIWIGSDIGVFVTNDLGTTWASLRSNMPIVAIMDMKYNAATAFLTVATHGRGIWRMNPDASTASSFLYFPRLVNTAAELTGIAVANPTSQLAQLTLEAFANDGTLLATAGVNNPRTLTIGSSNQLAQVAFQIFGQALDVSESWFKLSSNRAGLTGFFLAFDPGLNTMDGADVSDQLLQQFMFPEALNAEISLVNPGPLSAAVTIRLMNDQGTLVESRDISIPLNGRFSGKVNSLFGSASGNHFLLVSSDRGLAAVELFGKEKTFQAALNPVDVDGGGKLLFSPQFVVGGGVWKTTLTVLNLEQTATRVTFALIGADGRQIGRSAVVNLPPRGRAVISDPGVLGVDASGGIVEGYVRIESDATRIGGSVKFGDPNDSQFQTALPFASIGRTRLIYSQVAQNNDFFTGVAIINTNSEAANVTVSVFDTTGTQVGSGGLTIQPGERVSVLLTQIIPNLPALGSGYFTVTSNVPVFSFAVFGTQTLSVLSAIPPQALVLP